ncbi:hypothetical protein MMC26_000395 [Xylographa opegraphella]|nr:hypothetical protein [Xylographa opegraphella]
MSTSIISNEEMRRTYELYRRQVLPVFEQLKAEGKSDDEVVVFWKNAILEASLPNPRKGITWVLLVLRLEGHLGTIAHDVDLMIQGALQGVYQESDSFTHFTSSGRFSPPSRFLPR